MMIKTLDNVYINMEDFSGFTIGYPNDSDFTVMAMKELVDNQTATIELGRYPSEKEAKDALKKMIEHIELKSIQTATNVKDVVRKTGNPEQ